MTFLTVLLALILGALLARRIFFDFPAQKPADYADTGPAMDIRRDLSGPIDSEGIIYGPTGKVVAQFTAKMNGEWKDDTCILTEDFRYASGTEQQRKWTITMGTDGRFTATAPDVVGKAHGYQSGATVMMRYRLKLEPDAGGHILDVTDWIYRMENGMLINRSQMRKFNVMVAELVASMRPVNANV